MELSDTRQRVMEMLDAHHIPYEYHEHERAPTIEDCLKMPFIDNDVTICKNILLCNRQQTRYFLLLLKPLTPFRTAVVSKALCVAPQFCAGGGPRRAASFNQWQRKPSRTAV